MDREALIEALRPIRLPAEYAGAHLSDLAAAVTVGGALCALLIALLRPLLTRRRDHGAEARTKMAALRALPADERLFALATMLRGLEATPGAHSPSWLSAALYQRDAAVDFDALEAAIVTAAERKGGL